MLVPSRLTHVLSRPTCSSVNCPFGGIWGSAPAAKERISKLSSGRPGRTAAPRSPPRRRVASELRSRPLLDLAGLWHLEQCSWRIGSTWADQKASSAATAGALLSTTPVSNVRASRRKPGTDDVTSMDGSPGPVLRTQPTVPDFTVFITLGHYSTSAGTNAARLRTSPNQETRRWSEEFTKSSTPTVDRRGGS